MSDRFDLVEIRAARTMGEVDFFFRHQERIVATRRDFPPKGIMARMRKFMAKVLWKEATL